MKSLPAGKNMIKEKRTPCFISSSKCQISKIFREVSNDAAGAANPMEANATYLEVEKHITLNKSECISTAIQRFSTCCPKSCLRISPVIDVPLSPTILLAILEVQLYKTGMPEKRSACPPFFHDQQQSTHRYIVSFSNMNAHIQQTCYKERSDAVVISTILYLAHDSIDWHFDLSKKQYITPAKSKYWVSRSVYRFQIQHK